jgi:hypothetical protein
MKFEGKQKILIYTFFAFAISVAVLLKNMQIERAEINIDPAEMNETIRHWMIDRPLICLNVTDAKIELAQNTIEYYSNCDIEF